MLFANDLQLRGLRRGVRSSLVRSLLDRAADGQVRRAGVQVVPSWAALSAAGMRSALFVNNGSMIARPPGLIARIRQPWLLRNKSPHLN
jgi:hypothetical protein